MPPVARKKKKTVRSDRVRVTPTLHARAPAGTVAIEGHYYAVVERVGTVDRLALGGFGDVRLFPRKSDAQGRRSGTRQSVARVRVVIDE